ncbi:hypothetical protein CAPTEDRAFT_198560 [Capitella teleta]|uniref:Endonuclease/exonuclease/phosphatase domain-containing protein n=1 Tax=Capitella teleta TaxID=283909 RepID=R7U6F8_CAPTE|nr:hypothetical protein CAPTEDRAFT_198560 [Capitella teleta]|eukprot:ELT98730.1 hypothetical protein CAPTEDRAFT_198560 [Capitella teleta]
MNINALTEVIKSKDTRNSVAAAQTSQPSLYSDVVRSSVRNALQEKKARNEAIVTRIKESENETEVFRKICSEVESDGSPSEVVRLGKKVDGREQPLKVPFATSFDARRFCASVNAAHKENEDDVTEFRVRLGKTKSKLEKYKKNKVIISCLNEEAKEKKESVSYSIRDNGSTLKYKKQDDNKWIREKSQEDTLQWYTAPHLNLQMNADAVDVSSFEYLDCTIVAASSLRFLVIYQHLNNCHCPMSQFHTEFSNLLEMLEQHSGNVMIVVDLNFHLDDPADRDANDFGRLITAFGLQQHVQQVTHKGRGLNSQSCGGKGLWLP